MFRNLNVNAISNDMDAGWVHTATKEERVDLSPLTIHEGKVPNVKGMGLNDALDLLENQGLYVFVKGRGVVKQQSLNPGTSVHDGMNIEITLSL